MKKQEKVMAALLSSDTQAEAAEKCGLTTRTIRGYLADPSFKREYQQRKRQIVSDATRQIQASYHSVISMLRGIVENETSPESAKISAARALLEYGLRLTDTNDILIRLEDMEHLIESNSWKGRRI